jgi:hypothetical protein
MKCYKNPTTTNLTIRQITHNPNYLQSGSHAKCLTKVYSFSFDNPNKLEIADPLKPLSYATKGYFGFNTIVELTEFLKLVNTSSFKHFYEILKSHSTSLFFDYDKLLVDDGELNIIIGSMCNYINRAFETNIKPTDLSVYTKRTNTNLHKSIHIICKSIVADVKLTQKPFVEMLKTNTTYWNTFLDDKIYTKNREWCMPFNTKITKTEYFTPYNRPNETKLTIDMLINNTSSLTYQLKNPIIRLFNPINPLTKFLQKWIKSHTINHPIKKIFISPKTFMTDLLDMCKILPTKFYNSKYDWIKMTALIKYKGTKEHFDIFNKLSVEKSNNPSWTIETNNTFYNSLVPQRYGIPTAVELITKYLNVEVETDNVKSYLDFILNKLDLQYNSIDYDELMINISNNDPFIINGNKYHFDIPTKNLYNSVDNSIVMGTPPYGEVVGNYLTDYELPILFRNTIKPLETDPNVITIDTIQNIHSYLDIWINSPIQLIGVKCSFGCGKTYNAIRYSVDKITQLQSQNRIIIITENNALNLQYKKTFDTYDFKTHLDFTDNSTQKLNGYKYIICSIESSSRITFTDHDIIIFDEVESIFSHFTSLTTFKTSSNKSRVFNNFLKIFNTSNKIMILDADLSLERISLINHLCKNRLPNVIIKTNDNKFIDYNFDIIATTDLIEPSVIDGLFQNKKIAVASTSRNQAQKLFDSVKHTYPLKTILMVNGKGAFLYNDKTDTFPNKQHTLLNLEQFIIDNEVDCFIFSPSITTGVSINVEYFNKLIGYSCLRSICVRVFIQMLFRCRILKDKHIELHHATNLSHTKGRLVDLETIKTFNNTILEVFKNLSLTDEVINNIDIQYNPHYLPINNYNQLEAELSNKSFCDELIYRLKTHNFNVIIKSNVELVNKPIEEPTQITTEDLSTQHRLLTPRTYNYYKSHHIPISTMEELIHKMVFGGDYNGFYYEGLSNLKIPNCYKDWDEDKHEWYIDNDDPSIDPTDYTTPRVNLHQKYFSDDEIEEYQSHIEHYYFTLNTKTLTTIKFGQRNIVSHFYELSKVYNYLSKWIIGKDIFEIQTNLNMYNTTIKSILDTNEITNITQNIYALKILELFNINITTDLPKQIKYDVFKNEIDRFIVDDTFKQILFLQKNTNFKKTSKRYIGEIITIFNKILERFDIHIRIFENKHTYSKSTINIEYCNFRCRKIETKYTDTIIYRPLTTSTPYNHEPTFLTIKNNNTILTTDRTDGIITITNDTPTIQPNIIYRVDMNNPFVKSHDSKYKYNKTKLYKIPNGVAYKPKVIPTDQFIKNNVEFVLSTAINKVLTNVVNGFKPSKKEISRLNELIENKYNPINTDTFYYRTHRITKNNFYQLRNRTINLNVIEDDKLIDFKKTTITELNNRIKYYATPIVIDTDTYYNECRC